MEFIFGYILRQQDPALVKVWCPGAYARVYEHACRFGVPGLHGHAGSGHAGTGKDLLPDFPDLVPHAPGIGDLRTRQSGTYSLNPFPESGRTSVHSRIIASHKAIV